MIPKVVQNFIAPKMPPRIETPSKRMLRTAARALEQVSMYYMCAGFVIGTLYLTYPVFVYKRFFLHKAFMETFGHTVAGAVLTAIAQEIQWSMSR